MPWNIIVFNGVGAVMIIPYEIGKFTTMKEDIRIIHGMNSPVSGWIAVRTTVRAIFS